MGLKWGIFKSVAFEIPQKKVSIRGGHFSTHGGSAVDLKIVVIIKREIIHGENHANEVTECATSINTFIMWDISILIIKITIYSIVVGLKIPIFH